MEETLVNEENVPSLVFKPRPSIYNEKYLPKKDPPDLPERPKKRFISAVRAVSRNASIKKRKKKFSESAFLSVVEAVTKTRKKSGNNTSNSNNISSSSENNNNINPEQNTGKQQRSKNDKAKRKNTVLYIMLILCFFMVILVAGVAVTGYLYLKSHSTPGDDIGTAKTSKNDFGLMLNQINMGRSTKVMSIYLSHAKNLILDGNDMLCISKDYLKVFSLEGCHRETISLQAVIQSDCYSASRIKSGDFLLVCRGLKRGTYLMTRNGKKSKLIDSDKHMDVVHYMGKHYILGCTSISVLNLEHFNHWNIDRAIYLKKSKCNKDKRLMISDKYLYVICLLTKTVNQYSLSAGSYSGLFKLYGNGMGNVKSLVGVNNSGKFVIVNTRDNALYVCSVSTKNCIRSHWTTSNCYSLVLYKQNGTTVLWQLFSSELTKTKLSFF